MTGTTCTIHLQGGTGIWNYRVSIDDRPLNFNPNGVARTQLPLNTELYIRWLVRGASGTNYTISITPPAGVLFVSVGTHPISRSISKKFNSSSSSVRFFLRR